MYLILTIFLYLLVNRFAVRISLPFIYGIAYKLFLPIQEPTTEAPSTSIRFCLKTEFFFPSGSAYRLHVTSEDAHGKRVFSKPLSRVEIFEKAVLLH